MYRHILVDPRDRDYQRVLWRPRPTEPIAEYRLNTVTYGTRSSPYLAHRLLKQLVRDEGIAYPGASIVLERDTFVDDLLFGDFDEHSASQTRLEVTTLLKKAQLEPRKWASNTPHLISDIDSANHGLAWDPLSPDTHGVKVLGVQWNPTRDMFQFSVKLDVPDTLTKRRVLSILAQLFDPLGWVAPAIIKGKILMQHLWLNDVQWDDNLSPPLTAQWINFFESLSVLCNVTIPRWNGFHTSNIDNQLHGFADASTEAYGAVVYLRSINAHGDVSVSLIISKTKVAPLKQVKMHRLELQAELLLAELITAIRDVRAFAEIPVQCWTDSSITLSWLRRHASTWKLLVSNRVADIHALLPNHSWRHVPTQSNPADLASRGAQAADLIESHLWWNGPEWLTHDPDHWPNAFPDPPTDADMEIKASVHVTTRSKLDPLHHIALRFSTWTKAVRVTAYVRRYVHNLHARVQNRKTPPIERQPYFHDHLTSIELSSATITLYKHLQTQMFPTELRDLEAGRPVSRKSHILPLNPILDPDTKVLVSEVVSNTQIFRTNAGTLLFWARTLS